MEFRIIRDLEFEKRKAEEELEYWKRRSIEFENRVVRIEMEKVELQRKFDGSLSRYYSLTGELETKKMEFKLMERKLNDLILSKDDADNDLNEYKKMCKGMKGRISCLEEDKKVISEREKKVVEMLEELEKKERDDREKCVKLKTENDDLVRRKRRAEGIIEEYKKSFHELKTNYLKLKQREKRNIDIHKELEACKSKCRNLFLELEEKEKDFVMMEGKFNDLVGKKSKVDDELKEYKVMFKGLEDQFEREIQAQNQITYLSSELKKRVNDEREIYDKISTEYKDLECRKKRAEDEVEAYKKKLTDVEEELKVHRNCDCRELSMELKETKMEFVAVEDLFRNLQLRKIDVENELKEYKRTCNGLREQIAHLEEYQRVISEREKKIQERNLRLLEELKRMENEEKYVQLMTENRDLESWKKKAMEEIEIWKKNSRELEIRLFRLEEENSTLRCKGFNSTEFQTKEVADNNKQIITSTFASPNHSSLTPESRGLHVTGPRSVTVEHEHSSIKNCSPLELEVEQKQPASGLSFPRRVPRFELRNVIPHTGAINVNSDSEDEEITRFGLSGRGTIHVIAENENDLILKKNSKRLSLNMNLKENESSCLENILLSGIPKRKRVMKTNTRNIKDDDNIPIGELMKKRQELKRGVNLFRLNPWHKTFTLTEDQNVKESVSSSRKITFSRKQMISHQARGHPTAENGEENAVEELGFDSDS